MAANDIDLIDALRQWHDIEHGTSVSGGGREIDPRAKRLFFAMDSLMEAYDAADDAAEQHGTDSEEFEERAGLLSASLDEIITTALSSRALLAALQEAKAGSFTASADAVTEGVGAAASFRLPSSLGDDIPVFVDAQGNVRPITGRQSAPQPAGGYRFVSPGQGSYRLAAPGGGEKQIVIVRKKKRLKKKPKIVILER
jgi:hypothetical protein